MKTGAASRSASNPIAGSGTRRNRSTAGPQKRPRGSLDQIHRGCDLVARPVLCAGLRPRSPPDAGTVSSDRASAAVISRDLDVHRSGRRSCGLEESSLRAPITGLSGRSDPEDLLHEWREHRSLVGHLVQGPPVGPGPSDRARYVGCDHDHRRPCSPGLPERPEGIGRTRSGRRQCDSDPPGRPGVTVGGVGGGLLMTDRYEPDARAGERSPEREVVDSGQSEDDL